MQSDADHGFHAGEDADGDFDGLSGTHGVPRAVQQCADTFCGHEVARELDGYENRRQTVLFVGIVGCSRDFGQSRVQTLPVAQTEADILSVRVNAALLEGDIDDFTRRRRQNDGRVGGNTDIRPGNAHFGKQCAGIVIAQRDAVNRCINGSGGHPAVARTVDRTDAAAVHHYLAAALFGGVQRVAVVPDRAGGRDILHERAAAVDIQRGMAELAQDGEHIKGIDGVRAVDQARFLRPARHNADGAFGIELAHLLHNGLEDGIVTGVAASVSTADDNALALVFRTVEPCQQVTVVFHLTFAHFVAREIAGGFFVQRVREFLPQFGIVAQTDQIFRQPLIVPDREDIAVFAGVDEFGHAADIRADGRAAGTNALENGVREGFGHRGQQVDVHRTEERHDRRYPAAECHALTHAELVAQLFEHVLVLAVAGDEQAQLRRGFQRLSKAADGGRNILDGGQTRGNAAQHVAVLDLGSVGVPQIGNTVKFALRTVKIHTVVDFYNALRVKTALDERARHTVRDRLIEVEKAQGNGIRRAERVLLERTAEVVQPIIRVHGRDDRHLTAAAHHGSHQVGTAAVAVNNVGLERIYQVAHGPCRAERIVPLDHAHINAALARFIRKRTCTERDEHHIVIAVESGHGIHNLGLGAAYIAAAHYMHDSQSQIPPLDKYNQYTMKTGGLQNSDAVNVVFFGSILANEVCFFAQNMVY